MVHKLKGEASEIEKREKEITKEVFKDFPDKVYRDMGMDPNAKVDPSDSLFNKPYDKDDHKYHIFMITCKKKELRLTHIHMKDQCTLDATNGTNVCTDMIKYANLYYGDKLFDKHDGDLIHDNPSDYTKDDYNKEAVALMSNFSKERYQMLRTVAKRLFSKK